LKFSTLSFALAIVLATGCGDSVNPGGDIDASQTIDADINSQVDGSSNSIDAAPGSADAANNPSVDGGSAGGITCGDMTCTGGQICCVTQTGGGGGGGGGVSQTCTASDACKGNPITCDGAEDCSGTDLCCASFSGGGGGGGSGSAECGDPNGGSCQVVLCNDPTDCPDGSMCCPSPIGGGNVCSSFGCGAP